MTKKDFRILCMIIIMKCIQTAVYFLAKLTPIVPHLLVSSIDNKIPFIPHFIYFYDIWYLLIILIPFLLYKKDEDCFKKYLTAYVLSLLISIIIYVVYPTTITRPEFEIKGLSSFLVNFTYTLDYPAFNCMPSLHCIMCFFHIFYLISIKNLSKLFKIIMTCLELLIIASTVFIKQHVLIDVIAAFIIAILAYFIVEFTKKTWLKIKI